MLRRNLAALALAALAGFTPFWNGAARAQGGGGGQPVELQFWHGLPQPLGGQLEAVVAEFNASQSRYRIVPTFRGAYPETMVAAIAAFRANSAPRPPKPLPSEASGTSWIEETCSTCIQPGQEVV